MPCIYSQEPEKTLDIFNITLARQQAEVEVSSVSHPQYNGHLHFSHPHYMLTLYCICSVNCNGCSGVINTFRSLNPYISRILLSMNTEINVLILIEKTDTEMITPAYHIWAQWDETKHKTDSGYSYQQLVEVLAEVSFRMCCFSLYLSPLTSVC